MRTSFLRSALLTVSIPLGCAHARAPADPPRRDAPAETPDAVARVEYRGTVELEAHLANPGDTVPVELTWVQTCEDEACLVERSTGAGDDASTTRIWSTPEATWVEGAPARLPEDEAGHHRRLLSLFAPRAPTPEAKVQFAHPRLGTRSDTARYGDFTSGGVPESVDVDFTDSDVAWRGALALKGVEPRDGLDVPAPPPVADDLPPSIARMSERLWDVRVPAFDARSFVVEFETFVVVMEAPWSSEVGAQVVDLIARELPDKPIRYVLFSHHHPHYTGGLRAFMAAGASVIASTGHAPFVRSIGALDFSSQPDRFAETNPEVTVITFDGTYTLEEAGQSLQVFDIGERSRHTSVYNLVWLPEAKTLIEGDIGWFADDGAVYVNDRSMGLLGAIESLGLPVETLVQSWPVNSQPPTLEIEAFRAALAPEDAESDASDRGPQS